MSRSRLILRALRPVLLAALLLGPAVALAAETSPDSVQPKGEVVEIFSGIAEGRIEVRLIPRNSAKCNLLITNKTDKPLTVALPRAFAGVPVLAQAMMPLNAPPARNSGPQRLGVGPPGGRGPMMNPMMNVGPGMRGRNAAGAIPFGGPMLNIPPEKVARLRAPCVCLDHGKPNPNPRIEYRIQPIESCAVKDGIAEVCAMLGSGQIDQRAAQLAAWHLNNDLSWEKLAGLRRRATLAPQSVYTRDELLAGRRTADRAVELAQQEKTSAASQTASSR